MGLLRFLPTTAARRGAHVVALVVFVAAAPGFAGPPNANAPAPTRIEDALEKIEKAASEPSAASRTFLVRMALENPSARLRARAAEAIAGRADRDEAVGTILWTWSNSNNSRDVALRAAKALGRIPTDRSARALWIRRQHDDADVAFAIRASWMAIARSAMARETIATAVRSDPSPFVRALAARAVARAGGEGAPSALLAAAATERSPLVRDAIATALASLPRERVESEFAQRIAGAKGEARRNLFLLAALGSPSASPATSAAVAEALATRVPAGVAAALSAAPYAPETIVAARERLQNADPVVRDAAIRSWVRQLAEHPSEAIALARDRKAPRAARTALIAALAGVPTEAARDALVAIAKEPVEDEADFDVTATAVGALRRSAAPGARGAVEALGQETGRVRSIVEALVRAQRAESRPRAFVVKGSLDRVEECLDALGWDVTPLSSGNELSTIEPTPEDAILFDGPGEIDGHAVAAVRRFLHLGGSVVLGAGLINPVWRDLVPDALDPAPANLRLEAEIGSARNDRAVYAAFGVDPTLAASLEPGPVVMVVPRPVPLRTAAARPLLWSAEMEAANNGFGCVAAEVRVGCGRILAIGAVMGLRGSDSADGWWNRVRIDRTPGARFPTDEAERRRVAYDWLGLAPGRIAALGERGYFRSDDPAAGMQDLPAARFVAAWLRLR